MLTLLLYLIVLGVVAWVVQSVPMPAPFQKVVLGLLIIIMVVLIFQALTGGTLGLPRVN